MTSASTALGHSVSNALVGPLPSVDEPRAIILRAPAVVNAEALRVPGCKRHFSFNWRTIVLRPGRYVANQLAIASAACGHSADRVALSLRPASGAKTLCSPLVEPSLRRRGE